MTRLATFGLAFRVGNTAMTNTHFSEYSAFPIGMELG